MNREPETHTGEIQGIPYRICIPQNWNGSLFLSAQGWGATGSNLRYKDNIDIPVGNPYLLQLGYAWAASSFHPKHFIPNNSHNFVPYEAALDLAIIHDFFIKTFKKPEATYLTGLSMGGNTVLHALEKFPDTCDGAIIWATAAGLATLDYEAHTFITGDFAAGVKPGDYKGPQSIPNLTTHKILPALQNEPDKRELFLRLWTKISGGQRPFGQRTLKETYERTVGSRVPLVIEQNAFDNTDYVYPGDKTAGVSTDEINQNAIRIEADQNIRNRDPNFSAPSGIIPIPLMMMHTSGDPGTPLSVLQAVRQAHRCRRNVLDVDPQTGAASSVKIVDAS